MANPNPSPSTRFTSKNNPSTSETARKGAIVKAEKLKERRKTAEIIATLFQMKPEQLGIDVSDLPAELRDKVTVQDLGIIRQMQKYCDGQEADTRAFAEILDRFEGRPVQKIEADVQTTNAEDVSLDDALALARQIKSEKPKVAKPRTRKTEE